jgi:hypothetical protein
MRHLHLGRRGLTAALLAVAALAIGSVFGAASTGNAASAAGPTEQSPPTIAGNPQEGHTLTADPGKWKSNGGPISYGYQWRRCDPTGAACAGISGANARLYDLKGADVGHTLRVHVAAKDTTGTQSDTSAPTAVITAAAAPPPATGCPAGNGPVNVTELSPPARLLVDGQSISPTTLGRNPGDVTMKFHISACGGRSVAGALVYTTAVPFNQFSVPAEVPTGADGWGTLVLHQDAGYPASRQQQLLAVFVRARKSGENLLGGITTSRLVSFPVNLNG